MVGNDEVILIDRGWWLSGRGYGTLLHEITHGVLIAPPDLPQSVRRGDVGARLCETSTIVFTISRRVIMAGEAWMNNPAVADAAINRANSDAESATLSGAMDVALANAKRREEAGSYEKELFEAKKALHGQVAIKNALKAALKEVAPDHPMISPEKSNPILGEIMDKAEAETKPDSPWWP